MEAPLGGTGEESSVVDDIFARYPPYGEKKEKDSVWLVSPSDFFKANGEHRETARDTATSENCSAVDEIFGRWSDSDFLYKEKEKPKNSWLVSSESDFKENNTGPPPTQPLNNTNNSTVNYDNEEPIHLTGKIRLDREISALQKLKEDDAIVFVDREEGKNLIISAMIKGPEMTPYEDGLFLIEICLSSNYPFAPPRAVVFKRATYHPNIDETGHVNAPFLEHSQWTPCTTIADLLYMLHILLALPQVNLSKGQGDPVRGLLWEQDEEAFNEEATRYTIKYNM